MATKDTEVINGAGGEIMLYQPDESVGLYSQDAIQSRIFTIRGVQVMLDRDLAFFYGVETKRINEQIKRNPNRFPEDFVFQLTKEEWECLRSQNATIEKGRGQHTKYLPYVFTEPGVGQLSSVLRSRTADEVSVRIQRAFVAMRKYISANAGLFQRIESLEAYRLETKQEFKAIGERFDEILDRLDDGSLKAKLGVFFDGQMFDAFVLVEELIQKAVRRFATQDLRDAVDQYNAQYPGEPTVLHTFERSHDRWLIVDDTVYHFGASVKDLGKKWFAVDVVTEHTADELIARL